MNESCISQYIHSKYFNTINNNIQKIKKNKFAFYKFIILYKQYKLLKILLKIAEYYMAKKYHPNNILNYITDIKIFKNFLIYYINI